MIHVAIVSHGHEEMLISSRLGGLQNGNEQIRVWVKDNKPSAKLQAYCQEHGVSYTDAQPGLGFGENNNLLFDLIKRDPGLQPGDSFVVMNPDITIEAQTLISLARQMHQDRARIATINLYRDCQYKIADLNIRRFPDLYSVIRMALIHSLTQTYDKSQITAACEIDWASGALLAFDANHYAALQGFDEHYFMYFEDVDICYRSRKLLGSGVYYYPQLKAVHLAARQSRNLVSFQTSPHTSWFFQSFLTFMSRRYLIYDRQPTLQSAK